MSDQHAIDWYFGPGGDTERCSGSIDDYDGNMTLPAAMVDIVGEEGQFRSLAEGLFRSPERLYGLGPVAQSRRQ